MIAAKWTRVIDWDQFEQPSASCKAQTAHIIFEWMKTDNFSKIKEGLITWGHPGSWTKYVWKLKLIFTSHPRQVVTRAVSSNFQKLQEWMNSRMDKRATWMFSRMDERATRMSEWIEERMWLIETEGQEEPGNYRHWDEWPWSLVSYCTGVLLVLLIFLIGLLKNGGLDPPPFS